MFFRKRIPLRGPNISHELIKNVISQSKEYFRKEGKNLSALEKHVAAFGWIDSNNNVLYNGGSTAAAVAKHGLPEAIGLGIAAGSNIHAANGSLFGTVKFKIPPSLHLGTSRAWNDQGNIDKTRFDLLISMTDQDGEINEKNWHNAINTLSSEDKETFNNGRNTESFPPSFAIQREVGEAESRAMFRVLVHRFDENSRVASTELIKLFFEDTRAALTAAKEMDLPRSKDTMSAPLAKSLDMSMNQ